MALIRVVEIENFRAIKALRWLPGPGINCLIGPGDSGKSTVLDAIDLCLGARRSVTFTDADFHGLNYDTPIRIAITLGALEAPLKNIDTYGEFLVGFDAENGTIETEPGAGLETALTLRLTVQSDLEPEWTLVSPRAAAASRTRNLNWADRTRLAPTRLGNTSESNLTWRRGSVLNKISEERADASKELSNAARELREAFNEKETEELEEPLAVITKAALQLGVPVGASVRALIDAGSVTFSGGAISLHDQDGVPLRALGLGSTRLLIAGLQREASQRSSMILIDEVEHGLEPHRIMRLLGALGAKDSDPPLQVFMTSHSPVVIVELSAQQLHIVRRGAAGHEILRASDAGDVQGTIRLQPNALLAASIVVCEGASEIGLIRGLDQYFTGQGETSLAACGAALVNGNGDETFARALALQSLGYRTAILRDSDKAAPAAMEEAFIRAGGSIFAWTNERALEQELFASLPESAAMELLTLAVEVKETLVAAHIKTISKEAKTLQAIEIEPLVGDLEPDSRKFLGDAAAKYGWFKTLSVMERVGHDIVGPAFAKSSDDLTGVVEALLDWIADVGR